MRYKHFILSIKEILISHSRRIIYLVLLLFAGTYVLLRIYTNIQQPAKLSQQNANNIISSSDDIFIKQEKGTDTKQTYYNPFAEVSTSNSNFDKQEVQIYKTVLETKQENGRLYDYLYLEKDNSEERVEVFSLQRIFYPYRNYDSSINPEPVTEADKIVHTNQNGQARKIYAHTVSLDKQYVIFTTDEEIYVYDIKSRTLNKVYDQSTPSDIYQLEGKFKQGYNYCYKEPFIFSPDLDKVLVHKCKWEGTGLLNVDLSLNQTTDLDIPLGYGNKLFGWMDNHNILVFDILSQDRQDGLYSINVNDKTESLLVSLEGTIIAANTINNAIYFINSSGHTLELYKYDLSSEKLEFIEQSPRIYSPDVNVEINIWKHDNHINWDVIKGGAIYRYRSKI